MSFDEFFRIYANANQNERSRIEEMIDNHQGISSVPGIDSVFSYNNAWRDQQEPRQDN